MQLTSRSQRVLQLVVTTYIHTAKAVSSQTLVKKLPAALRDGRGYSAASLRATMVELTEAGLLMQPHKSGGRMPTEAGLRRFVDTLLAPKLRPWDRNRLDQALGKNGAQGHAALLSQQLVRLTGQVAMVAVPRTTAVSRVVWNAPVWEVVVEGAAALMQQPEYQDRSQLHGLLNVIEQKALMLALVEEMLAYPGVLVRLGSEHGQRSLTQMAYVGCGSASANGTRAAVGLFGPPRMDYGRLVPLVQYAAQGLVGLGAQP